MAIVDPVEIDDIGVGEDVRVAVGGRERQQHPIPRAHGTPGDVGVLEGDTAHGHGRVGPKEFFHRLGPEVGIVLQLAALLGVLGQVPQG